AGAELSSFILHTDQALIEQRQLARVPGLCQGQSHRAVGGGLDSNIARGEIRKVGLARNLMGVESQGKWRMCVVGRDYLFYLVRPGPLELVEQPGRVTGGV